MNSILAIIYKNRIENLLDREYYNMNSIEGIGYFGKSFDEIRKYRPTDEDLVKFRHLAGVESSSEEYKFLHRKLTIWKILDSCVDYENNSIAELITKIEDIHNAEHKEDYVQRDEDIEQAKNEYILFFDTETSGVPRNLNAPLSDLENWPRLVQLAYILFDNYGNMIYKGNWIVKPTGYSIPQTAIELHGITNEIAAQEGLPLSFVLQNFDTLVRHSNCIVAHNIAFDEKIIAAEFLRNNMPNSLSVKNKICTMERTTNFCAIEGAYGYKWPKLSELYFKIFNTTFNEMHNATIDIQATSECFWELRRRKLI